MHRLTDLKRIKHSLDLVLGAGEIGFGVHSRLGDAQ